MSNKKYKKQTDFKKVIEDNDIIQQAMNHEPINTELYMWLGADILKLSYIKHSLENGMSPNQVAKWYGVTEEGIYKFILKDIDVPKSTD